MKNQKERKTQSNTSNVIVTLFFDTYREQKTKCNIIHGNTVLYMVYGSFFEIQNLVGNKIEFSLQKYQRDIFHQTCLFIHCYFECVCMYAQLTTHARSFCFSFFSCRLCLTRRKF